MEMHPSSDVVLLYWHWHDARQQFLTLLSDCISIDTFRRGAPGAIPIRDLAETLQDLKECKQQMDDAEEAFWEAAIRQS
ncbi:MAG TPA: hypothetical protein VFB90_08800 [Dehalococcoidia bacterium]|nr:hypothetical protein [Dehalococcoidia bacterium]